MFILINFLKCSQWFLKLSVPERWKVELHLNCNLFYDVGKDNLHIHAHNSDFKLYRKIYCHPEFTMATWNKQFLLDYWDEKWFSGSLMKYFCNKQKHSISIHQYNSLILRNSGYHVHFYWLHFQFDCTEILNVVRGKSNVFLKSHREIQKNICLSSCTIGVVLIWICVPLVSFSVVARVCTCSPVRLYR